MPLKSITTARFSMWADILKQGDVVHDPIDPLDYGEFVENQDPLTGEIVRIWVPFPDDTNTPDDETVTLGRVPCLARGIVDGGIRVAGSTENFGATYQNMEFIKMWTPAGIQLTKNDRITNIRNHHGHIMWVDEEFPGTMKSTTFNVNGVTPLFDAFNRIRENFILLERAEVG
jgi:hypothetical protein